MDAKNVCRLLGSAYANGSDGGYEGQKTCCIGGGIGGVFLIPAVVVVVVPLCKNTMISG
jgi:hypothetical protein